MVVWSGNHSWVENVKVIVAELEIPDNPCSWRARYLLEYNSMTVSRKRVADPGHATMTSPVRTLPPGIGYLSDSHAGPILPSNLRCCEQPIHPPGTCFSPGAPYYGSSGR
jgi:hypothetical protein